MWLFRVVPFLVVLFLLASQAQSAQTLADIPVGSKVYDDLERLEVKGLLPSAFLSTRPFSRAEARRLLAEARHELGSAGGANQAQLIIGRLSGKLGGMEGYRDGFYLKPLDSVYLRYLYSDRSSHFKSVNNGGDEFGAGSNLRSGFISEAGTGRLLTLYWNPEYRSGDDDTRLETSVWHAKASIGGVELLAGRESLWWGAGDHGGLILTDNARPLEMVKVTSAHPFILPWILGELGPIRPTVFLARLEENRDFPRANLLGMRLDIKPLPSFQIGFNRAFMFGGEGRRSLGASEWLSIFYASDGAEHTNSPVNGNQLASIDMSLVYVNRGSMLPFSGVKLYTEWGAEDSSGDTKTPTGRANIYGIFMDEPLRINSVDLRVEWANTARNLRYGPLWYRHGTYTSGYTYEGNVIGHHMGGDSRDLFARARYHADGGAVFAIETDRERNKVHSVADDRKDWIAFDLMLPAGRDLSVSMSIGREKTSAGVTVPAGLELEYRF